jgi:hypothetical protein
MRWKNQGFFCLGDETFGNGLVEETKLVGMIFEMRLRGV